MMESSDDNSDWETGESDSFASNHETDKDDDNDDLDDLLNRGQRESSDDNSDWETEESDNFANNDGTDKDDDNDDLDDLVNRGQRAESSASDESFGNYSDCISNDDKNSDTSSDSELGHSDSEDSRKSGHAGRVPCGIVLSSLKHLLNTRVLELTEETLASFNYSGTNDAISEEEACKWLEEETNVDEDEYRDILNQLFEDESEAEWNYLKIDDFVNYVENIDVTTSYTHLIDSDSKKKMDISLYHDQMNDSYIEIEDFVSWLQTNLREDNDISILKCLEWVESKGNEIIMERRRCCAIYDGQLRSMEELCKKYDNPELTIWLEAEEVYASVWYEWFDFDSDDCKKSARETDMDNGYIRVSKLIDKLHAESQVKGTYLDILEQQDYVEDKAQNVMNKIKIFDAWFEIEERIGTGSFYDGTKILETDEFDYLGILAKSYLFQVEDGCQPGTCHFKIRDKTFLDHINTTVAERILQQIEHPDGSHFPSDTERPDEFDKLMKQIRGSDDEGCVDHPVSEAAIHKKSEQAAVGEKSFEDADEGNEAPLNRLSHDEKWSSTEKISLYGAEMMNKYFSSLVHRSFISHNRSYGGHSAVLDPIGEAPGFGLIDTERSGPNVQSSISGPLCDADVDFTLAIRIDPSIVNEEKYGQLKHPHDPCIAVAKPRISAYSGCSLATNSKHEMDAENNNFCWLMSFTKAEARRVRAMKPHHKKIHKILKLFASKELLGKANNSYTIKTIMCQHDEHCVFSTNAECLFEVLETIKQIISVKEVCEDSTCVTIGVMLGITKLWIMEGENMPGYRESDKEVYEELAECCKQFGLEKLSDFELIKSEAHEHYIASRIMAVDIGILQEIDFLIQRCHAATVIAGTYHSWVLRKPFHANMHISSISVVNGMSLNDVFQGFSFEDTEVFTFDRASNVVLRCIWIIEECLNHQLKIESLIRYFDRIKCFGGKKLLRGLFEERKFTSKYDTTPILAYLASDLEKITKGKGHLISESLDEYKRFLDNVIGDKDKDSDIST